MHRNNKSNSSRDLTLDQRAFYMLQSIEGTQNIIDECMKRYRKDGNLDALKIAFDGYVQLGEMFKKVKEMSSFTLYRCDKCSKEFTSLETLREHKATGCNK